VWVISYVHSVAYAFYYFQEAARNNGGKAAHSAWRNYDDFNEYFWFVSSLLFIFAAVPKKFLVVVNGESTGHLLALS